MCMLGTLFSSLFLFQALVLADSPRHNVDFQVIEVPLFHEEPGSRKIKITFARLSSVEGERKTPILYLSGGPGSSAVRYATRYQSSGNLPAHLRFLLRFGPVYLIDQRGTGTSEPDVWCDLSNADDYFQGGDQAAYMEFARYRGQYCHEQLATSDNVLNALNTLESAHDIELVRQSIGAEKVVLYGESYGTHLALAYIRQFEDRVERAVLNMVEGPDHTRKLPLQFDEAIERIDAYRKTRMYPPLLPLMKARLEEFEATGVKSFVRFNPGTMIGLAGTISKFEFQMFLRHFSRKRDLDYVYEVLHDRNYSRIAGWLKNWREKDRQNGMFYAMDCASGASKARENLIRQQASLSVVGMAINYPFPEICETFGIETLDDEFRSPLQSDVPTLFFSGTLDFRTPPSNAAEVAEGFSNAKLVEDKDGFHNFCMKKHCLIALRDFFAKAQ